MVIDTNVLIYYLQNNEDIVERVNFWQIEGLPLFVSVITMTEILAYSKLESREIYIIKDFLSKFVKIPINEQVAEFAGRLRREYKIEIGDALIAATAILLNQPLSTRNLKDFKKIKGLQIVEV